MLKSGFNIIHAPGEWMVFNTCNTSIHRYLEQLEQYSVANIFPADSSNSHKQFSSLLLREGLRFPFGIVLSEKCIHRLHSWLLSWETSSHLFAPNKLVVAETCRFENCTQREGEGEWPSKSKIWLRLARHSLKPSLPQRSGKEIVNWRTHLRRSTDDHTRSRSC